MVNLLSKLSTRVGKGKVCISPTPATPHWADLRKRANALRLSQHFLSQFGKVRRAQVTLQTGPGKDCIELLGVEAAERVDVSSILGWHAEGDEPRPASVGTLTAGRGAVPAVSPPNQAGAAALAGRRYGLLNTSRPGAVVPGPTQVRARGDLPSGIRRQEHRPRAGGARHGFGVGDEGGEHRHAPVIARPALRPHALEADRRPGSAAVAAPAPLVDPRPHHRFIVGNLRLADRARSKCWHSRNVTPAATHLGCAAPETTR